MRSITITAILLCFVFFAAAQKVKTPSYFYTQAARNYFSDAEMDSLLYNSSMDVFKANMVPADKFAKVYPGLKAMLILKSKTEIVQSFKEIEATLPAKKYPAKGSEDFYRIKALYTAAMKAAVERTFFKTTTLSSYLVFSTSDRIAFFNSTIRVQHDGKLLVTENIRIYNGDGSPNPIYGNDSSMRQAGAMNNEIKRGIVRTFPLYYINKYKIFQNTTFSLKKVLKNGSKENYHTKTAKNGIAVYIGNEYISLPTGYYNYTITYETDHQLKFLKNFDELYWNVTGNGWNFRIDSAKCTIIIPKGAGLLSAKYYTGFQGEKYEDGNFTETAMGDSVVGIFKTTKPLLPKQGLTVAVSWNKGFVTRMGTWQRIKYYIWNNKAVFFLPLAALFSAIFCFIFWWRYGRDPVKGTIYPQYEPPAGYPPAGLGYIYYQKFTRQLTAATIVDAAVRNHIKIDVEREGLLFKHNEYHIKKSDKHSKSPVSAYQDFKSDIQDMVGSTIKKGKYNKDLADLNKEIEKHCKENYLNKQDGFRKGYRGLFVLNTSYTVLPMIVCFAAGLWALIGGVIKAMIVGNYWQIGYFILGWILCAQVFRIFSKLLAAYSPDGRKLMDKIEGFRMFLSAADEKRFDAMAPPQRSLELYEKYLPFAIALGCELEWGQKFEDIINTAYLGGAATSSFSQSLRRDNNSFSSSFASSFSGAISSASTPPSSSSGGGSSFGGGSSGGGGGGGGGGGW